MNIGVLGTGFGSYHVQLLKNMNEIKKIVVFGRDEGKLHKLRTESGVEITTSLKDILSQPDIDVVDICLPSDLHSEIAITALQNGKHVYCETPVCLTLEDAHAMKRAEEESGKQVIVNQFIKFERPYQFLEEAIRAKQYGDLLSLSLKRETAPLWGDLGLHSICSNLMIHELDFMTWALGTPDQFHVWGVESIQKGQAMVQAVFEHQGKRTQLTASSLMPDSYPFTVGYEAYFERAKLVFCERDANGQTETALYEYSPSGKQEIALESANPYEKSLEHAIYCFQNHTNSIASLGRATQSLAIALDIKQRLVETIHPADSPKQP